MVFVPGVVTGVNMAAHAFVSPGQGLLIQTPVYMPFLEVAQYAGGTRQEVSSPRRAMDGTVSIGMHLRTPLLTRPACFILCNPHNPVGRVFTRG